MGGMDLQEEGVGRRWLRLELVLVMVLAFPDLTEAMLSPLDFLALQSIRKSLEDMPGSSFFSSWDFSADPCGFPGILCSPAGAEPQRVVALNLGDSEAGSPGLKGKLHGALGFLTALVELTVVPGEVVGSIPETLGELKELQFVGISRNFVSGTIPESIGALQKLQTLDLSYNQIAGSIPSGVGLLPALSNLVLCHNKLTGTVPDLSASVSLVRLDLKQNALSGKLPSLPPSLKYLSLSNNQFEGDIQGVGGLQHLSYIDLSFNKFGGSIPVALFGLRGMSSLQLQRNGFTGPVKPEGVVSTPVVDLSYNLLDGQISPLLASVQNLYLNNNHFTGAVPRELVDRLLSADIRVLYLQHNYLTEFPAKPSASIPLSSSLCIQYNCMVPPIQSPCPSNVGKQKMRPKYQCRPSIT